MEGDSCLPKSNELEGREEGRYRGPEGERANGVVGEVGRSGSEKVAFQAVDRDMQ